MNILRILIMVGLGGGIGSIFRYLASQLVQKYYNGLLPLGTLLINVAGSLLIGILLGCLDRYQFTNTDFKYLFITGFCGGFTTFSTFSAENIALIQSDHAGIAFTYIGLSVMLSLAACWAGLTLFKMI